MRRSVEYIGSRRFAIYLLVATLLVVLLANLLPNFSIMKPEEIADLRKGRPLLYAAASSLQLSSIVRSPIFLLLPVFIFASITACTLKRVKKEWGRAVRVTPGDVRYNAGFSGSPGSVVDFLRTKGWRAEAGSQESGESIVVTGFKGGGGFWGSVGFHVGMNVVLIGTALSLITRFNASVVLTEGYGVELKDAFLGAAPKGFPIKGANMEGFRAVYVEGFPVDYSMELGLWGDEGRERAEEVKVNKPLNWKGYQFAPLRYGFSPRFVMKKDDKILLDGYVNLVVMTPEQLDSFDIPEEGIKTTAQFFPEFYKEGTAPKTRSKEPKNPVFFVEIARGKDILGSGFLHMNQEVSFAGYTLKFDDIRMWVMFDVSRDLGVPVVTFGFILIVAGLIIRFILGEKHIWIYFREGMLEIGGRSRYFPALFEEEMRGVAGEIEKQVKVEVEKGQVEDKI